MADTNQSIPQAGRVIRSQLTGIGAYLPRDLISNDELAKRVDTSDAWIRERTGITERRQSAEGELTSDLAVHLHEAAAGSLTTEPTFSADASVCIVLSVDGYPAAPRVGDVITGIEAAEAIDGVTVFAAGVRVGDNGGLVTAGGRVLNVVGRGPDFLTARRRAYEAAEKIDWPGRHFRSDIGPSALPS